jgi:hypothetical protein
MQNAKQYITETEDGYELSIGINEQCGNYTVESIDFYVAVHILGIFTLRQTETPHDEVI